MEAVIYKTKDAQYATNNESIKFEEELIAKKMQADYRILDCGSTKKKALYVCENATLTYRWISEKEENELKMQGKIFVTDF